MPQISTDLRERVVLDRKEGLSYQQLADKYKISKFAARNTCIKFLETGSVENRPGCGRKRKTTEREDVRYEKTQQNPLKN